MKGIFMEKMRVEPFKKNNLPMSFDNQIEKVSHDAGKKVGEFANDVSHLSADYVKSGKAYVKTHPITGVSIAAGAGVMIGSLMTMALSRRSNL
jgi:ElaB/YqjD/DUF883 family membrane-anchored ribosome-binding protein